MSKSGMKEIKLVCQVITPLYMGGAMQQPELRTQSFNGVFRYWFRLLGGKIDDEKKLFGWGGDDSRRGVARIIIKTKSAELQNQKFQKNRGLDGYKKHRELEYRELIGYKYLGFSLIMTNREDIKPGQSFDMLFRFDDRADDEDMKKFLCAVWCSFYLGNFGSRSRRGFGSVIIATEINGDWPSDFRLSFQPEPSQNTGLNQNIEDWLKKQLDYIKSLGWWQPRKGIPFIYANMEIYKLSLKDKDYRKILDTIGTLYKDFRGKLKGNYWKDRIWFGLPIANKIPIVDGKPGRRPSTMTFKILKFDDHYEGFIIVFKPSQNNNFEFLPARSEIKGVSNVNLSKPNWNVLDDFITKHLQQNQNQVKKIYP